MNLPCPDCQACGPDAAETKCHGGETCPMACVADAEWDAAVRYLAETETAADEFIAEMQRAANQDRSLEECE